MRTSQTYEFYFQLTSSSSRTVVATLTCKQPKMMKVYKKLKGMFESTNMYGFGYEKVD